MLQHDTEGTALRWVGAGHKPEQHFQPRAVLPGRVLASWPGSLAVRVIASCEPTSVQKVQEAVIPRISSLVVPSRGTKFGRAVLEHGLREHLVCRHVNDAGTG